MNAATTSFQFHEAANEFPLLSKDRLDALVEDIQRHGLHEPIMLCEGKILDGRNRYLACEIAGAEPQFEELPNGIDPFAYVWSLNGERRDLAPGQRYEIWKAINEKSESWQAQQREIQEEANRKRSAAKRGNQNAAKDKPENNGCTTSTTVVSPKKKTAKTRAAKAKASKTNAGTVARMDQLRKARPDLADQVKAGTLSEVAACRQMKDDKKKADLQAVVEIASPRIIVGDFREKSDQIADSSVELVFTDPPYDRDSLTLYEDAARVAARILKPGGSLIAYCGHYLLPEILPSMQRHLRYWWLNACIHTGAHTRMKSYGIVVGWKPLIWFVKGTRGDKQTFVKDIISGGREKSHHEWQQAENEASYYIENLTSSSGLVVDFCAGGGTTCMAAQKLGRPWIAFEINPTAAKKADERVRGI